MNTTLPKTRLPNVFRAQTSILVSHPSHFHTCHGSVWDPSYVTNLLQIIANQHFEFSLENEVTIPRLGGSF